MNGKKSKALKKRTAEEFAEETKRPKRFKGGQARNEFKNKYRNLKKRYLNGEVEE
jgi:hypothetical protein